ncbi:Zinc/iron permease [Aspergillus heterothallicus]
MDTSTLLFRSLAETETNTSSKTPCQTGNDFNGNIALRISAIFVIFLGSLAGILFPLLARPQPSSPQDSPQTRKPDFPSSKTPRPSLFFAAKFFGSGVIIATAFIHLLAPASESLRNPCLAGVITEYPWVEAITLMSVFGTFFVEVLVDLFGGHVYGHGHSYTFVGGGAWGDGDDEEMKDGYSNGGGEGEEEEEEWLNNNLLHSPSLSETDMFDESRSNSTSALLSTSQISASISSGNSAHFHSAGAHPHHPQPWKRQLASLLVLESGVILHSIFIGLSLAVTGPEFKTLYAVLVFHQTFEGLGLGIRLAEIPWPTLTSSKQYTPYLLGTAYALSTPLAIAVGLLIRNRYSPGSHKMLVVSGVFDAISAGILIYTGLVELMAGEFLFHHGDARRGGWEGGDNTRRDPKTVLAAFFWLCAGAAAMAVLGKWA